MKTYSYILSFFFTMFISIGFVHGQNSNPPVKNENTTILQDSLAKSNSNAKQKNLPQGVKLDQDAIKPEKASTCNGDNNPLKKHE